jgi:hypothetical protein
MVTEVMAVDQELVGLVLLVLAGERKRSGAERADEGRIALQEKRERPAGVQRWWGWKGNM